MSDDAQVTRPEEDAEVTQASSDSESVQNDNPYDADKQRLFSQDSQIAEGHRGETNETSESRLDESATGEPDDNVESAEKIIDTGNSSDELSVKSATNAKTCRSRSQASCSHGHQRRARCLAHTKIMDKPEDYSRDVMKKISAKYAKQAKNINQTRSANMTDNTVIMILSETFSDPTRVPGVSFSEDPMPNIRQLKTWTTSGLMLSPGYGGGTANIEYQALTGLSMANYSSALSIAYQQLVPSLKWTPSLNQAWNAANGEDASVALHAYNRNMYFRDINYKKFAFSKIYATNGVPQLKDFQQIDSAWYASDESFYKNVLEQVSSSDKNKFYQVVTMQNHMPYEDFYTNNQFKDADMSQGLPESERQAIPALSVPSSAGGNSEDPVYLDANGNRVSKKDLPKTAKAMLHEYQLIQYDMSAGKNYLKSTGFVELSQ